MILILAQLALLLLTAWGWGFWLWKIVRPVRTGGWERHGWFFFGLGGLMACILFLHALIYLNLPLRFTAWAALLVAVAGVATCAWRSFRTAREDRRDRRREAVAAGLLFAAVFGFQGAPLFEAGPDDYYGSAHTDQVNYVLLSEFLVEMPYSTATDDVGLRPWLVKGVGAKEFRKGQSVANGYLAVATLVDAKRAYGTLSIFMVAVGALSVFVLARTLAVPRGVAWLTGCWWGVLPAVTKLHLDGFLSQACILLVFPALAALFRVRRGQLEFAPLALSAVYLAYLLCTYTEVYVIGLGLLFCLLVLGVPVATPWWRRGAALAGVAVGSLLLTGPYLYHLLVLITYQYNTAASPLVLADLVPLSGTWLGWKQIFVGYAPLADARLERLSILAGFALLFLMVCAFQYGGPARRRFLLAMLAPPLGVLAILLSAPQLPKYAFSKLLDTFTTFWLVLVSLGILTLCGTLIRGRIPTRLFTGSAVGLLTLVALAGSWPQWRETWQDHGILADVDSPGARRCYARAEHDPRAVYLIDEPHNLLCAWLAYAARHSQVYLAVDQITDTTVPASLYAFRRPPPPSPNLVVLDEKGPVAMKDRAGLPVLVVDNPQGVEGGDADHKFYWLGPDATLRLSDYFSAPGQSRLFALNFEGVAGPANPAPERSLVLVSPDGSEQKFDFTGQATGRFAVKVQAGENVFKLKVAYPTEQTVWIPNDPRNHMVRLQQVRLSPWDDSQDTKP